jgi:hypothetical protein
VLRVDVDEASGLIRGMTELLRESGVRFSAVSVAAQASVCGASRLVLGTVFQDGIVECNRSSA